MCFALNILCSDCWSCCDYYKKKPKNVEEKTKEEEVKEKEASVSKDEEN